MSASERVSIRWQVVFAIIFPLSIWAFYRIRRLRRYLLYVLVPLAAVEGALYVGVAGELAHMEEIEPQGGADRVLQSAPFGPFALQEAEASIQSYVAADIASSVAFAAFAAYLVVRWSREWNARRWG